MAAAVVVHLLVLGIADICGFIVLTEGRSVWSVDASSV